jgi:hypothetical protein
MATLDGKEVPQCVHCTQFKPDAKERIITKPAGEVRRVLCDGCAEVTAETYPVKSAGRQSVKTEPEDETPPAATTSTSRGRRQEE